MLAISLHPNPELDAALVRLLIARQRFDLASGSQEEIDAAVHELTAAQLALRAAVQRLRAERKEVGPWDCTA